MNETPEKYIDVDSVVRTRAPRYYRFIPRFLIRKLERIICQDRLNELWHRNRDRQGLQLCEGLLSDLRVKLDVVNPENLPDKTDRRVLFVSNHPLGGLDGIALIDLIGRHYGVDPLFVVNDLLMALTPFHSVFVPINKFGAQSRDSVRAIDEAFESDRPVIIFPAGLVSRRQKKGVIADLEWQKMFVMKARRFGRDIIPLYFSGGNSPFFYKFAKFRKKIGLRFNIEMIYLPREVFRCEGKTFTVFVGKRIPVASIEKGNAAEIAERIKRLVYFLPQQTQNGTKNN